MAQGSFQTFADSLDLFHEALALDRRVSHLHTMATDIRILAEEDPTVMGVCWYPMSVSENPWCIGEDEEEGCELRYNFLQGTDHKRVDMRGLAVKLTAR